MDLRSTAPVEAGRRRARLLLEERDQAWPVAAAPQKPAAMPRATNCQEVNEPAKESEEKSGERRKGEGGRRLGGAGWARERPGASGQVAILPRRNGPSLFFSGAFGRAGLPCLFQVISARRGGAAADAVVGAGGPIGRQDQPGFGRGRRVASAVRCPCPGAGREKRSG